MASVFFWQVLIVEMKMWRVPWDDAVVTVPMVARTVCVHSQQESSFSIQQGDVVLRLAPFTAEYLDKERLCFSQTVCTVVFLLARLRERKNLFSEPLGYLDQHLCFFICHSILPFLAACGRPFYCQYGQIQYQIDSPMVPGRIALLLCA